MSKKIPIKNTGKNFLHVGGRVIPPNETHLVDEHLVPPALLPKPAASESVEPTGDQPSTDQPSADQTQPTDQALLDLVAGTVSQIVPQLAALSDDDLVTVHALELEGDNRKGVLEAIEAEKLERATRPPQS